MTDSTEVKWIDNPAWPTKHPLPLNTRVRNHGEQYFEAEQGGTGKIIEVKGPYYDGSYEYLVQRDKPMYDPENRPTWWASYNTKVPLYLRAPEEEGPNE